MNIRYKGMIGSRRCEKSLEEILEHLNDPKITHIVMRQLQYFKSHCKSVLLIKEKKFAIEVLRMCRNHALEQMKNREGDMSKDCFTHWHTCLISDYRDTSREIKSRR